MDPSTAEPQSVHELLNLYDQKSAASPSKKSFLLLIGGAVVVIILIVMLFMGSRGGGDTASFEKVLSAQQTILATVEQSNKDIRGRTTLNFVTRVETVVASDQALLLAGLGKNKVSSKSYKSAKDTDGLAKIKQAAVGNKYDDALTEVLSSEIADYQTKLQSAYEATKSTKVQSVLSEAYKHTTSLKP